MSKLLLTTGTVEGFFAHGRKVAKLADQGLPIPEEVILRFEDPAELASLISERRIHVFREIKSHPGTVKEISTALGRSLSSVKRDIDILERAGVLSIKTEKKSGERDREVVEVVAKEVSIVTAIS